MKPPLAFWTDAHPGRPQFETAVSRALMLRVAEGAQPETFRLHRTEPVMAFSPRDARRSGFDRAVAAARVEGFAPVMRLAGGHAAAFHAGTLAFAWSQPVADWRDGLEARFETMASILSGALRRLGADARVGPVPGEYCPGEHSVNARGQVKLCGTGQRVVSGAAHVGGVIVVSGSAALRRVLEPVYRALDLPLEPSTVGSLEDEIGPISRDAVAEAVRAELAERFALRDERCDALTRERARQLEPDHALPAACA